MNGPAWEGPAAPLQVPEFPQDRLDALRVLAAAHPDGAGAVDLSAGIPVDPPPPLITTVLSLADPARPYPPSIGSGALREAAAGWLERRLGVTIDPGRHLAACIGTKELVAGLPHWLRLRQPRRDTVLYPAVSYPTYAMGAALAGCRAVPVPLDDQHRLDVSAIDPADAARALCLWSNSPGNPAGGLDDLGAIAAWGREHDVLVASDECYVEFTWDDRPRTVLEHGTEGVLAVHSISKRSNLAGLRVGFYAGDPDVVAHLSLLRKHAGFMVPGPAQAAAAAALGDDAHVDEQRARYRSRLSTVRDVLVGLGSDVELPGGAFYLWAPVPDGVATADPADPAGEWAWSRWLAEHGGVVVTPGEIYTEGVPTGRVRLAVVATDDDLARVASRLGA